MDMFGRAWSGARSAVVKGVQVVKEAGVNDVMDKVGDASEGATEMIESEDAVEAVSFVTSGNLALDFFKRMAGVSDQQVLYFYLVDEVTKKVIVPPAPGKNKLGEEEERLYPIKIKVTNPTFSEKAGKLLPLMNTSMKVMKGAIGVAGLLGSLGVPFVPDSEGAAGLLEAMDELVGGCSQESSVEDYTLFEKHLSREEGEGDAPPGKVHGGPLRELARFLNEHDPRSNFCGMERVVCPTSGCALWTLEADKLERGDESVIGNIIGDTVSREQYDSIEAENQRLRFQSEKEERDAVEALRNLQEEKKKAEMELLRLLDELSKVRPRSPRKGREILEARERDKEIGKEI
jgi:hypothetical protein